MGTKNSFIMVSFWQMSLLVVVLLSMVYSSLAFVPLSLSLNSRQQRLPQQVSLAAASNEQQQRQPQDPVLGLPLMEAKLATLSHRDDNYESLSSSLKVDIENARTGAEFGVRRAQVEFYEAFSMQNYERMKSLWSTESPVSCIHPGMSRVETLPEILKSWQGIFQRSAFVIKPLGTKIQICGGTAIVTCHEEIEGGTSRVEALNIYKRENGTWRMTLHMAAPVVITLRK
jgi:SnoaL-like domain